MNQPVNNTATATVRKPELEDASFTDIVELPSKGKFYTHKKGEVIIELMSAPDEDILTSTNLIRSGTQFDVLLKAKIKDPDFVVDDLLRGDKDTLLLFLRCTSYGLELPVSVYDPTAGEKFDTTVDLSRITAKEVVDEPDEDGLFTFELPVSKKIIRFRLLTDKEETSLQRTIDAKAKRTGNGVQKGVTERLITQIVSIDGNIDKLKIIQIVNKLPVMDSYKLRVYMHEVEPGLDTSYEFVSPTTGETFLSDVNLGTIKLFYPSAKL